jgi:predicted transcriptional regulator
MQDILKVLHETNDSIDNILYLLNTQKNHLRLLTNLLQSKAPHQQNIDDSAIASLNEEQIQLINDISAYNKGISKLVSAVVKGSMQTSELDAVFVTSDNGRSVLESVAVKSDSDRSIFPSVGVSPDNSGSNPDYAISQNKNIHKIPISIDVKKIKQYVLWAKLKAELPLRRSRKTIRNISIILKTLFENNKHSHQDLMNLTGMSVDGMAKHIQMLKKNQFIIRVAYQQYQLTEKSLNVLRSAMIDDEVVLK